MEDKHKVLFVPFPKYSEQPQVLTLGAQESWRTITKSCPVQHYPSEGDGRCVNGMLYYKAEVGVVGLVRDEISG